MLQILAQTAAAIESLAVIPIKEILKYGIASPVVVPIVKPEELDLLDKLSIPPKMIELEGWYKNSYEKIQEKFPKSLIAVRINFPDAKKLTEIAAHGVRVFHLLADYHGRGGGDGDRFVLDLIRDAHLALVAAGIRQEVTLLGSGGMIAAEHIPKAILVGLDAVGLDTPVFAALQVDFNGQCADRESSQIILPDKITIEWGMQRLKNLTAAWRDQLLEIMGAMGLREVRRMRGEMGRAMFMLELEAEAFEGVGNYESA